MSRRAGSGRSDIEQRLRGAGRAVHRHYEPELAPSDSLIEWGLLITSQTKEPTVSEPTVGADDPTQVVALTTDLHRRPRPRTRLVATAASVVAITGAALTLMPGSGQPALAYNTEDGSYVYDVVTTFDVDGETQTNSERMRYIVRTKDGERVVVGNVTVDENGNPRDGVEFIDDDTMRLWTNGEFEDQNLDDMTGRVVVGSGDAEPDLEGRNTTGAVTDGNGIAGPDLKSWLEPGARFAFEEWGWVQPTGPFAGEIPDGMEVGASFVSSPAPPGAEGDALAGLPRCTTTLTERDGDEYKFHTDCTTPSVEKADSDDSGAPLANCQVGEMVSETELTIDASRGIVSEWTSTASGGGLDCEDDLLDFDIGVSSASVTLVE